MSTTFARGFRGTALGAILALGSLGVTFDPSLAADPTQDADSRLAQATDAFRHARYPEAEEILSKLAADYPQKGLYWFNLGNVLYLEKKFRDAIPAYEQVATLQSPLAAAATLGKAKSLRQTGNLEEAWATIGKLRKTVAPGSGLGAALSSEVDSLSNLTKKKGVAAYKAGSFKDALDSFTLLAHNSPTEKSEFLRAMCLYQLGDPAAGEVFTTLSRKAVDSSIRSASLQMTETLAPQQLIVRPSGILELSGGYNSNFFSSGPGIPIISGPSEVSLLAFVLPWAAEPNRLLETDLVLQDSEVAGFPSDRFVSGVLQQRFVWRSSVLSAEITPESQALYIGTKPFMVKAGGRIQLTRFWSADSVSFNGNADHNFAPSGTYSYMAGYSALAQLVYGHQFPELRIEGSVSYVSEHTQDYASGSLLLPLTYTGPSLGLAAKYVPSDAWIAVASYNYSFRNFSTFEQPDNVQRTDHLLELSLRVDRRLSKTVSLFVTAYLAINQSTLGEGSAQNENYHAYRTLLGASWAFL